ncbi:hypothetical protein F0344_32715 [Streptomyces finlayi]|uniref:Uncharacterized protein n=1 Tax=Streptomyces finlayi TaxID=67296 RepID=A0A7G7BTR9_9ACTN|nr:hypothetical protein F0344_32715 [Streptomyces finlayi]
MFAGGRDGVFAGEPTGTLDSPAGDETVARDPVAAAHADEVVVLADRLLIVGPVGLGDGAPVG